MNYIYHGENSPVVLHDYTLGAGKGRGIVVYRGQVINVEQTYIGKLDHTVFTATDKKVSTPEEIEALKGKKALSKSEKMEALMEEAVKVNTGLQTQLESLTKDLEALRAENEALKIAKKTGKKESGK